MRRRPHHPDPLPLSAGERALLIIGTANLFGSLTLRQRYNSIDEITPPAMPISTAPRCRYARHLAERLKVEQIERCGSDLLGPFVSETQAKIAAAIAEAAERGALSKGDGYQEDVGDGVLRP